LISRTIKEINYVFSLLLLIISMKLKKNTFLLLFLKKTEQ